MLELIGTILGVVIKIITFFVEKSAMNAAKKKQFLETIAHWSTKLPVSPKYRAEYRDQLERLKAMENETK